LIATYTPGVYLGNRVKDHKAAWPTLRFAPYLGYADTLPQRVDGFTRIGFTFDAPPREREVNPYRRARGILVQLTDPAGEREPNPYQPE
jgi:hypothetical protein